MVIFVLEKFIMYQIIFSSAFTKHDYIAGTKNTIAETTYALSQAKSFKMLGNMLYIIIIYIYIYILYT